MLSLIEYLANEEHTMQKKKLTVLGIFVEYDSTRLRMHGKLDFLE